MEHFYHVTTRGRPRGKKKSLVFQCILNCGQRYILIILRDYTRVQLLNDVGAQMLLQVDLAKWPTVYVKAWWICTFLYIFVGKVSFRECPLRQCSTVYNAANHRGIKYIFFSFGMFSFFSLNFSTTCPSVPYKKCVLCQCFGSGYAPRRRSYGIVWCGGLWLHNSHL